jgi:hypothetical protein
MFHGRDVDNKIPNIAREAQTAPLTQHQKHIQINGLSNGGG